MFHARSESPRRWSVNSRRAACREAGVWSLLPGAMDGESSESRWIKTIMTAFIRATTSLFRRRRARWAFPGFMEYFANEQLGVAVRISKAFPNKFFDGKISGSRPELYIFFRH